MVPVRNARESKIKKRTEKANLNDKNDKATSSKVKQNGNGRNSTNSSLVIGKTRESVSAGNLVLSRGNSLPKLDPIIEKSVSNNNIKIKKRTKSAASSAPHDLLKGLEKVDRDRIPFSQVSMRQFQSTLSPQSSPKHAQDNRQADGSYDANRSPKSNKKIQNNSIMNIKNTTRRGTDKDSTQIKNHDGDKKTDDSGNDVRAKTPHDDLETTMKKLEKYERYQKSDSSSNINTESDNYQQLFAKHAKKLNSHFVNAETHSSQYKTLAYGPESILSTLE